MELPSWMIDVSESVRELFLNFAIAIGHHLCNEQACKMSLPALFVFDVTEIELIIS